MLAIQYALKDSPQFISAGVGLGTYLGFMGRIVGVSLANSVFANMIQRNLHKYVPQLPGPLLHAVVNDATAVWTKLPEQYREPALVAYTETMRVVYIIGVPLGVLGIVSGLFIRNSKMPSKEEEMAKNAALKEKEALEDRSRNKDSDVEASPALKEVELEK